MLRTHAPQTICVDTSVPRHADLDGRGRADLHPPNPACRGESLGPGRHRRRPDGLVIDRPEWRGPGGDALGRRAVQPSWPRSLRAFPGPTTAASGVSNLPASPTAALGAGLGRTAAESSAASSPASTPFVPITPGASGIDVSGRAVDGPSTTPAPSSPSSRGFSPGQPSTSPGSPSSYQASPAGLADSRSTRLAGGPTNSIAASQGPTIPATGAATTPGAGSPNPATTAIPASGAFDPSE